MTANPVAHHSIAGGRMSNDSKVSCSKVGKVAQDVEGDVGSGIWDLRLGI